jgi:RNA-directed DNA polymerase
LDQHPTTEEPNNEDLPLVPPEPSLEWWAVRSKVRLPVKVAELRRKLYLKAKQEPKFRFYALYDRIYRRDVLTAAWWIVLAKNKSPGLDGVTCQDIMDAPGGANKYLDDLHESLKNKTYKPDRVKRTYIDKPDGGKRPLGIPSMRDRIAQTAAVLILESIFEADFLETSYAYRPGRDANDAIQAIEGHLRAGYREVYDADLKGYFDSIPHAKLLLALEKRIADRAVLQLIQMWLRCELEETDSNGKKHVTRSNKGTPQGGVVSALLSNVYLHWFEVAFHKESGPAHFAKAKIVRYADDFVVLARYQGKQLRQWLEQTLEGRFELTINRDKTRVVNLNVPGHSLDFVSYTFRYDQDLRGGSHRYLNIFPSRKALAKARETIRYYTRPSRCFMPVVSMIADINAWQTGWVNYFRYGYPRRAFRAIHAYTVEKLTKQLKRRSQRPYCPPAGKSFYAHLHDLGLRRP